MTVVDYDLWGKFAYNYFNIHPLIYVRTCLDGMKTE